MGKTIVFGKFEWDDEKNRYNIENHHISFEDAVQAFLDSSRILAKDEQHSEDEERIFCIGLVAERVATVRFTLRGERIRIIGAGYWRKGKKLYEEKNGS